MNPRQSEPPIGQVTRAAIRRAADDLRAAHERREAVTRPDGTDDGGHPGIIAANLEGYLGRFAVPLLNALEVAETEAELLRAELREIKSMLPSIRSNLDGIQQAIERANAR